MAPVFRSRGSSSGSDVGPVSAVSRDGFVVVQDVRKDAANAAAALANPAFVSFDLKLKVKGDAKESEVSRLAVMLSEALVSNRSMQVLKIRCGKSRCADDVAKQLMAALVSNRSLASLELTGTFVGDGAGKVCAEALKSNASLSSLIINGGQVSDVTGKALAEVLATRTTLKSLELTCDGFGNATGQALAEALMANSTLASLKVSGKSMGAVAGETFAKALAVNSTLTCLDLEGGYFGNATGKALAVALKTNNALKSLRVMVACADCQIDASVAQAFAEMLRVNVSLTALSLDAVSHKTPAVERALLDLQTAVDRNRQLAASWSHLARISRKTESPGLLSVVDAMTDEGFRFAIAAFSLPSGDLTPLKRLVCSDCA